MTRLWPAGQDITVQCAGDPLEPICFTWMGKTHEVIRICNHWRVHMDWWREEEVQREYFKLQTRDGLLCTVYYDLQKDVWRLAQVFD